MIPKIIHYCWFGHNPLPKSAKKCIASWKKYMPDFEIKEWNEDNFDVNIIPYTHDAYNAKKYAFVSDYARYWVLYHYGGVYFDTDVEVIRPMDDILDRGAFMGIEKGAIRDGKPVVAPGLGIGIEKGHPFYKKMLDLYAKTSFYKTDGSFNSVAIVWMTSRLLYKEGMIVTDEIQNVKGIWIYPDDYFCPMDCATGIITKTNRTHSIHHYDCSWMDQTSISFRIHQLKNSLNRILGPWISRKLLNIYNKLKK